MGVGAEIVHIPEYGIGEARTRCSKTEQCVSHGTVEVIDNRYGSSDRAGENVRWQGDAAVWIQNYILSANIFAEMPGLRCRQGRRADAGPAAERVSYESIRAGLRQQGTEVSLIGVVGNRSLRPGQRHALGRGIKVADASYIAWAASVHRIRQNQRHECDYERANRTTSNTEWHRTRKWSRFWTRKICLNGVAAF